MPWKNLWKWLLGWIQFLIRCLKKEKEELIMKFKSVQAGLSLLSELQTYIKFLGVINTVNFCLKIFGGIFSQYWFFKAASFSPEIYSLVSFLKGLAA